jgi:DNA-binding CsgD family transcriptional regulator
MPKHLLSSRELEALAWAAQGKTYKEISIIMDVACPTVKCYLDSVRYKLHATNLVHAVALALVQGYISMSDEVIQTRQKNTEKYHGEMGVSRWAAQSKGPPAPS